MPKGSETAGGGASVFNWYINMRKAGHHHASPLSNQDFTYLPSWNYNLYSIQTTKTPVSSCIQLLDLADLAVPAGAGGQKGQAERC